MATEPIGNRRGKAASDGQLQLVPFVSADLPQSLRRARLGPDRQSHDEGRGLAADQHESARTIQRRGYGEIGEMAGERARYGFQGSAVSHVDAAAGPPELGRHN